MMERGLIECQHHLVPESSVFDLLATTMVDFRSSGLVSTHSEG